MLNFTELSQNGRDLELLIRELLFAQSFDVFWSGQGQDGGRDLICLEKRDSIFVPDSRKWLLQCKHNAHSGKSVSLSDLDDIIDSCYHHQADGYVLVCSTYPSSKVVERLENITANPKNRLSATYWDAVRIERMLSTPKLWPLAQRFFPISGNIEKWNLYATEKPNHWIANFRGFYFHLTNRIGSNVDHLLSSIEDGICAIEDIPFPKDHFIRVRAIFFDDKVGLYRWYIDYMHPYDAQPIFSIEDLQDALNDGTVWDNGQWNYIDVMIRGYSMYSDHYDPDHYDYYVPYIPYFLIGANRHRSIIW